MGRISDVSRSASKNTKFRSIPRLSFATRSKSQVADGISLARAPAWNVNWQK